MDNQGVFKIIRYAWFKQSGGGDKKMTRFSMLEETCPVVGCREIDNKLNGGKIKWQ